MVSINAPPQHTKKDLSPTTPNGSFLHNAICAFLSRRLEIHYSTVSAGAQCDVIAIKRSRFRHSSRRRKREEEDRRERGRVVPYDLLTIDIEGDQHGAFPGFVLCHAGVLS